jgi:5'-nucleotidase
MIYSGTMSALMEEWGIPAIGFSLLDYDWNANFDTIKPLFSVRFLSLWTLY